MEPVKENNSSVSPFSSAGPIVANSKDKKTQKKSAKQILSDLSEAEGLAKEIFRGQQSPSIDKIDRLRQLKKRDEGINRIPGTKRENK